MIFLVADGKYKLNKDDQNNSITNISDKNNNLIIDIFGDKINDKNYKTFDVINCQFVLHHLFENKQIFDNVCHNINKYLKKLGYLIITTTDGNMINKLLDENNGIYNSYLDTNDGDKIKLFEIIKKYNTKDLNQYGLPIDVYISMYMK
jgi:SAM-dependent methyltransferase